MAPDGGLVAVVELPVAPTIGGAIVIGLLLLYWLLRDRTPMQALQTEVAGLRQALADQSSRHAREIGELNGRLDALTERYDEQRSMKHKALNDVAKTVMALDLVQRLSQQCTCDVLGPVHEIVDRLVAELSTFPRPDPGGSR